MILLVSGATKVTRAIEDERLGALLCPTDGNRIPDKGVWACDNSAFSKFDAPAYVRLVARVAGNPACLWITAPDSVASARVTDELWRYWSKILEAHGLRPAYVGQDGMRELPANAAAFFIGGSTRWKLGQDAARWAAVARARGLWVHMGRVNTLRRLRYAELIGCDSVDGSSFSRFSRAHIPWALRSLRQLRMALD